MDFTDLIQRLFYILGVSKNDVGDLTYSELRSYAFAKAELNGYGRMSLSDDIAVAYSSCRTEKGSKIRKEHFSELFSSFKEVEKKETEQKKKIKKKEKAKANRKFFQNAKLNIPK